MREIKFAYLRRAYTLAFGKYTALSWKRMSRSHSALYNRAAEQARETFAECLAEVLAEVRK